MQDPDKAVGKYKKVMPDFVKIHEPKEDYAEIKPESRPAQGYNRDQQ
jgi:hypothetical protein